MTDLIADIQAAVAEVWEHKPRQTFADIDDDGVVRITDEHGALIAAMSLDAYNALVRAGGEP